MRMTLFLLLLPLFTQAAEHDHEAQPALAMAIHDHGGTADMLLMVDRFEHQWRDGEDAWQWQGSYDGHSAKTIISTKKQREKR